MCLIIRTRLASVFQHLSISNGGIQVDASFMQTLWNIQPTCSSGSMAVGKSTTCSQDLTLIKLNSVHPTVWLASTVNELLVQLATTLSVALLGFHFVHYVMFLTCVCQLSCSYGFLRGLFSLQGYLLGGHVMRLCHGHDESLTIPGADKNEEEQRSVDH